MDEENHQVRILFYKSIDRTVKGGVRPRPLLTASIVFSEMLPCTLRFF